MFSHLDCINFNDNFQDNFIWENMNKMALKVN